MSSSTTTGTLTKEERLEIAKKKLHDYQKKNNLLGSRSKAQVPAFEPHDTVGGPPVEAASLGSTLNGTPLQHQPQQQVITPKPPSSSTYHATLVPPLTSGIQSNGHHHYQPPQTNPLTISRGSSPVQLSQPVVPQPILPTAQFHMPPPSIYGAAPGFLPESNNLEIKQLRDTIMQHVQDKIALEKKLHIQSQTVDILAAEKADLTSKLDSQARASHQQKAQLDETSKREELFKRTSAQLEANNAELTERIESQAQKLVQLEREFQASQHRVSEQQRESFELRTSNAELLQKLTIQAKQITEIEREKAILLAQSQAKDALVEQLSKGKIKAGDDLASIQRLLEHKLELERQLEQKTEELDSLEAEVTVSRKSVIDLQIKEEGHAKKAHEASEKAEQLASLHAKTQEELQRAQQLIASLEAECANFKQEGETLRKQLDQARKSHSDLTEQMQGSSQKPLAQLVEERDRAIEELQHEIDALKAELRDKSILSDRLRESSDRIDRLSVENKALFAQLAELRERLVELTNEKAEVTDRFQSADAKATKFQKELDRLREAHRHEIQNLTALSQDKGSHQQQPQSQPSSPQSESGQSQSQYIEELKKQNFALVAEVERLKAAEDRRAREDPTNRQHIAAGPSNPDEIVKLLSIIEAQKQTESQLRTEISLFKAEDHDKRHVQDHDLVVEAARELQQRYEQVMKEKEALKLRLNAEEINIAKLQMEVETIPEYIEMYHRERNNLKAKMAEKEKTIAQLIDRHEKQKKQLDETRSALQALVKEHERVKSLLQASGTDHSSAMPLGGMLESPLQSPSIEALEDESLGADLRERLAASSSIAPRAHHHHLSFPPCRNCQGHTLDV